VHWLLRALVLAAALATAITARADTVVIHIEGVASKRFGRDVGKALPQGLEVDASPAVTTSVKQTLRKHPLSKISEAPPSDDPLIKSIRKALRKSKRDLAVVIVVDKARNVRVLLVPASDDRSIFFQSTELPHFQSADEHVAWWADLFEQALQEANKPETSEPAPEPAPAPEEAKPAPAEPKEEAPKQAPEKEKPSGNDVNYLFSLGPDLSSRQFFDNENGRGTVRTYRAFPVSGFHLAAELYPIADGHVGLEGGYGMSLGVQSKSSDGQPLGTTWIRADGALKFRVFTASRSGSPWLALLLGYGYSRFAFDDPPANRDIPVGIYEMLRVGLDGRAPIDRVSLSLGAEYDHLVSIAALGNLPAGPSGNGLTIRGGVGFGIVPEFSVRLEGRYTWLRFELLRDIPSVAVDQYLTGSLTGELAF
jgi:hypothetical protein